MKNHAKFIKNPIFIDLFIDTIILVISTNQITCDNMCVQHVMH